MRTWTVAVFLLIGLVATAQAAGLHAPSVDNAAVKAALPVLMAVGLAVSRKVR
ncbi:MAG: hypothetical protein JST30_13400 [Armatimonadetes bacterium]|nr:hypothetical protein [Armatimonadota bacterium]